MPTAPSEWNQRYADQNTPWDSGAPSVELQRLLAEFEVAPCRTLEIGCGTGTNAIHLAEQGFHVTAVDIAPLAIEQAQAKAAEAGVTVDFQVVDLTQPDAGFVEQPPFDFIFDRGVYHVIRRTGVAELLQTLQQVTQPGSLFIALTGNANDLNEADQGPPRVAAEEICRELEGLFRLVQLREFHFDEVVVDGVQQDFLGWSVAMRRR